MSEEFLMDVECKNKRFPIIFANKDEKRVGIIGFIVLKIGTKVLIFGTFLSVFSVQNPKIIIKIDFFCSFFEDILILYKEDLLCQE